MTAIYKQTGSSLNSSSCRVRKTLPLFRHFKRVPQDLILRVLYGVLSIITAADQLVWFYPFLSPHRKP